MRVLILTADSNGGYPVPAVRGGAVSTLIEHIVSENNRKQLCDLEIVSFYDKNAQIKACQQYPKIKFTWINTPKILKLLDLCAFNFVRILRKNKKAISFRSPFSLLWYIYKAKRIVNKTNANKVVIENNIPLVRIVKKSKFTGEWYYHLHNIPRINAGCRSEFKKITKFICVSKFVAEQITSNKSVIGKIPLHKTEVLFNCVDTRLFRPISKNDPKLVELRKKFGFGEDDFICIFSGRLSEEKGAYQILKALQTTGEKIKCLIVGSLLSDFNSMTEYQKNLYELANNIKSKVFFTGYISQIDLAYYYNLADVAILPSIWDEPAGLTNIEAVACGLPVITTRSGGIPEYVGDCGKLLKRDELLIQHLKETIYEFKEKWNEDKYSYSVKRVLENFNKNNYLEKFLFCLNCSQSNEIG